MPDSQGNLLPGEPGYQAPGTALLSSSSTGQQTLQPGPTVTTYTPAQTQAQKASAVGYDPAAFTVTPEQTVQGQVLKVIGDNSPLLQQAEARAKQAANDRGLLNSSIAVGEGQKALYDAALPIAQQDASAYNQAMTNTTNALLASRAFKSGAENTAELQNAYLGTQAHLANQTATNTQRNTAAQAALQQVLNTADNTTKQLLQEMQNRTDLTQTKLSTQNQLDIAKIDNTTKQLLQEMQNRTALTQTELSTQNQLDIAKIDQATKIQLGYLDANNRQLLQTNASAANAYQQTVQNIANIATSNTMSPDAKDAATSSQLNLLNEALKTLSGISSTAPSAVGSLNLSQYFAPGSTAAPSGATAPGGTAAPSGATAPGGTAAPSGATAPGGTAAPTYPLVATPSSQITGLLSADGLQFATYQRALTTGDIVTPVLDQTGTDSGYLMADGSLHLNDGRIIP